MRRPCPCHETRGRLASTPLCCPTPLPFVHTATVSAIRSILSCGFNKPQTCLHLERLNRAQTSRELRTDARPMSSDTQVSPTLALESMTNGGEASHKGGVKI